MEGRTDLVEMTADIVAAYVSANLVSPQDLPALVRTIHGALREIAGGVQVAAEVNLEPAVSVKKSVTPDFIICLEDGKRFKSLKRHLRTRYAMSPEEYRTKWSLPHDYPMVAPNYAKARSDLAKRMGLGLARKGV